MLASTPQTTAPKALADGEGDARWFLGNLATIKVTGEETGGQFSLAEIVGPKGDMPPLHVHHVDDETFMVIDGELTLFVGGQQLTARPGSVLFAPKGIPHTYRVESETATWRVISSPPAFPEFLERVSEPAAALTLPPGPPAVDPEQLAAVAAEHGIEILGPPGALPA